MLGDEIDFAFATPTQVIANVEAGKFRALATTAAVRAPQLPNVPILQEALALEDFDVRTWFALTGPAEMHDRVARELATWTRIVDDAQIPKQ